MVMELNEESNFVGKDDKWTSAGLETVKLSFVNDINQIENCDLHEPGFVYQHFGENEMIFGYEDLQINVIYTDLSLYFYPDIKYKSIYKKDKDLKPDDIISLLKEQLPSDQMNILLETRPELQVQLTKQKKFKPFGEMISKFNVGSRKFAVYKISESSEEFDRYLERAQTLALWYIEAANYTDNSDEHWLHYFIYEECDSGEGDGKIFFKFAGYATLYRYYAYPDKIRPRIAQILLLPQYRRGGNGARFLQSIYRDLWASAEVMDITVEDPADNFILLRDYVDCLNCLELKEFSAENLRKGFSNDMSFAAMDKLKIGKKQARRIYEILRYRIVNKNDNEDLKNYRIDIKRRLNGPMKKSEKDWKRLNTALQKDELIQAAAGEMDENQKLTILQKLYEQTIEGYEQTIDRIDKFPSIF